MFKGTVKDQGKPLLFQRSIQMNFGKISTVVVLSSLFLGCASNPGVDQTTPNTYETPNAINFVSGLKRTIKVNHNDDVAIMVASQDLNQSQVIESLIQQNLPDYNFRLESDQLKLYGQQAVTDLISSNNAPDYLLMILANSSASNVDHGTECYSDGYGYTSCDSNTSSFKQSTIKAALMDKYGVIYNAEFDVEEGGQDTRKVLGLLSSLTETTTENQVASVIVQDLLAKKVFVPLQKRILEKPEDVAVFQKHQQCFVESGEICRFSFEKQGYISKSNYVEDIDNVYPTPTITQKEEFWAMGGQKGYANYKQCHYDGGTKCFYVEEYEQYFDLKEYYY